MPKTRLHGRDIRDETLTGRDIKDGSLSYDDLDINWREPVQTTLPTTNNEVGDTRVVQDELAIYTYDGSSWQLLTAKPHLIKDTSFPSSPYDGQECFRTDLNKFYKYTGDVWIQI